MHLFRSSVIDHRRRQSVGTTSVAHSAIASCANSGFLPHFDVICDQFLNRCTKAWTLFVKLLTLIARGLPVEFWWYSTRENDLTERFSLTWASSNGDLLMYYDFFCSDDIHARVFKVLLLVPEVTCHRLVFCNQTLEHDSVATSSRWRSAVWVPQW